MSAGFVVFGANGPILPQSSYSTSFPGTEDPISQGGLWVNGFTTGVDWNNVRTTPGFAFGKNNGPTGFSDPTALLTGPWAPNVRVTVTVAATNPQSSTFQEVEIRGRSTLSAHVNSGYEINWSLKTNQAYCEIVRWNGAFGSFTYLSQKTGGDGVPVCSTGGVMIVDFIGPLINVYLNGTLRNTATDATYPEGMPGMGFFGSPFGDFGFSSWSVVEI